MTRPEYTYALSSESKEILLAAHEEARHSYHPYVATEHLLFALLNRPDGVALQVLRNLGLSISKLRQIIEFILPRSEHLIQETTALTPQVHEVLDCAEYEAGRLHQQTVQPEHLLLGILRQSRGRRGQGLAAAILHKHQVTLDKARTQTLALYQSQKDQRALPNSPQAPPQPPAHSAATMQSLVCADCGTPNPPVARFCFRCGSPRFSLS